MPDTLRWREIATEARARLKRSIPREWQIAEDKLPPDSHLAVTHFPAECGILSPQELDITNQLAVDIVKRLATGEWTSEEVIIAFCKRASIAHQLTNCLTTTMFEDAVKRARELDQHFAATGKTVGPLHGLPISLKDCFNVPGHPTSVGFTAWALDPVQEESVIVSVLRKAGAVFYVKTNVPTSMMYAESVNNCYGRTVNPLNRNLTSGGSSGGESALIAMRGSCLGVGTDIGGSLRIPAACCGLYAIRPSLGRTPHFDSRTALAGQEAVASVNGPMGRSIADLRMWMEAVISLQPWLQDPKAIEIPYRDITLPRNPKIAILWHNGIATPTPPVTRALKSVVDRLKAKGYEIIDWPSTGLPEAAAICKQFFLADGGRSVRKILQETGEPWRPEMAAYEQARDTDVYDLWQLQKARTMLQAEYLRRMVDSDVDAILGPTTPWVAPRNGQLKTVAYTNVFSVLDYSSVSFPSGLRADNDDKRLINHKSLGEIDAQVQQDYDWTHVYGLPISLQLTARRLQEEKVLALVERIEADLKG